MKKSLRAGLALLAAPVVLFVTWSCGGTSDTASSNPSAQAGPAGGMPGGGGPGGMPAVAGRPGGGGDSPIKQIMRALDKGPSSLRAIDQGLNAEQPAWEKIQPQTAEYAKLTAELGKADPPKGSKETWAKLTAAYAASATELDKAAQAKDLNGTRAAHRKLAGSCMECHREHRGGGRGGFGGGDVAGGGFPGGGPPGGGGYGGGFAGGARGGFAGFPQPGQVMAAGLQDSLKLTPEQKKQLDDLQKEVDAELAKILTDQQKKQLQEMQDGLFRGGFGAGGRAPPGG